MDKPKKISTTQLAKKLGLSKPDLSKKFEKMGWTIGIDKDAKLTDLGKEKGGEYTVSERFGTYIVWPSVVRLPDLEDPSEKQVVNSFLNATQLGEKFNLSSRKINALLNERGWMDKVVAGWYVTKQGERVGGLQKEIQKTGALYAVWADTLLTNKIFLQTINQLQGDEPEKESAPVTEVAKQEVSFRECFPAKHRTTDGHMVRSKAEAIIDNWLYMAELVHAYERRLPVEEELYCDFYIPGGRVYIEYWGYENKKQYLARKKIKLDIYKSYDFNLIELDENDVANLDDVLPKKLLKFGVKTY